jgi:hypothetical protein
MKPVAERVRETRERRREGALPIRFVVAAPQIDFLLACGYPLKRTDKQSVPRRSLLTSPIRSWRAHERRCSSSGRGQSAESLGSRC